MRYIAALALLAQLLAGVRSFAADTPGYKALEKKHQQLVEEYQKALKGASTPQSQEKLVRAHHQALRRLAAQFLDFARKAPKDPQAIDALSWVVVHCPVDPAAKEDPRATALDILGTTYLSSEKIGPVCTRLVNDPGEASEAFLRKALTRSKYPSVQARACMSLAVNLKFRAHTIKRLKEGGETRQDYEESWGKGVVKQLLARDPDKLLAECEKLLQRTRKEFGDIKHPLHGSLADMASVVLETLRNPVTVDKPAPEIKGTDLAGKPLKLSDYRGKVVLLDFGGRNFAPSVAAFKLQQSLLKKYAGKPFAVLSVNADPEPRAQVAKALVKEGVTWPVWYDGGNVGGPIATRWDVELWPTVFLIDHKGIVRAFSVGWPTPEEIEGPVKELLGKAGK